MLQALDQISDFAYSNYLEKKSMAECFNRTMRIITLFTFDVDILQGVVKETRYLVKYATTMGQHTKSIKCNDD